MLTIPSILEKNSHKLLFQIERLSKYFSRFQIDIADGLFVPNKTVQIEETQNLESLLNKDRLLFDFHLMVKDYEIEIKKLEKLKKIININYIFIHFPVKSKISSFPIGLTLNPSDQINDLIRKDNIFKIPFIQIMSVVPGAQGNPFLPQTLNKIEQLRQIGYRKEIFLDGAVNEKTIPIILANEHRPNYICPGSFLTKAKDLEKNVKYLKRYA